MRVSVRQRLSDFVVFGIGGLLGFAIGDRFGSGLKGLSAGIMLAFCYLIVERLRKQQE